MFRLEKQFRFEASHQLPLHDGKCKRLHGHSWVGRVVCEGDDKLLNLGPQAGMLLDYGRMSAVLDPVVERYLDHWHLNNTLPVKNPTSEEIARWLYYELKPDLPLLVEIIIEETCTSRCIYRP